MFNFLNQTKLPFFWKMFQMIIGGTSDKRRLATLKYDGEKKILEIGCSLGNISKAFVDFPDITFKGVDIDPVVIEYAKKDFKKYKNFEFVCNDVSELLESNDKYDYILLCGMLHHINDSEVYKMLEISSKLLDKNGKIVIIDPVQPEFNDNFLIRNFVKLDKGNYIRTYDNLSEIIKKTDKFLNLVETQIHLIGATPISRPKCARFALYLLTLR